MRFPASWTDASLRWGRRSHSPIAIEFRDHVARMVQVRAVSGEVVAAARVAHDPARPQRTAAAIARAVESGDFIGCACVVGLPFAAARAETMTVEDGEDAFIRAIVESEAPLRFGCAAPQVGFLRLGEVSPDRVEIAAIAAERSIIEGLVYPLIDVGLLPDAAEPSFLSVARASSRVLRRATDQTRTRVVVDASESGAVAMLMVGSRVAYCRSTDDLTMLAGAIGSCIHDGMPFAAGAEPISEIRLSGARAEDEAIARLLERDCGVPVRLDDERSTIGTAWRSIGHRAGADRPWDWTGAFGLALRGDDRARMSLAARPGEREAA